MSQRNRVISKRPPATTGLNTGLKRKRAALQHNESYFYSLVENSSDVILVVNDDGTLRYENPSIQSITGYRPEEREGGSIFDLIHPDDIPRVADGFSQLVQKQISIMILEICLRHKDGSWRFIEAVGRNLLDDPTVKGIMVNLRDVTERKQAEDDLRIKENALENSINAIAMSDMEGMITYVNQACMRLWGGGDKGELLGKPYWELLKPDTVTITRDIGKAMFEHQSWEGELAAKRKDGKELRVHVAASLVKDDRGNPIQTISSFMDVTEKIAAEKALKESEAKFRRFVEEMNDCYCVLQGSKVVFTNARGAEMFGFSRDEVIGKTVHELLLPEIVKELEDVYRKRRRGERRSPYYETTIIGKNGTSRPVELGVRVIEYAGKSAISLVARDISNRKQIEEALRESEARFRAIFESAAIGIALVNVGGNPVTINPAFHGILGYTAEEFIGMDPDKYLYPEDAMMDAGLFTEMVAGKRDHYQVKKRLIRNDGQVIWAQQTLSLVRDVDNHPQYVIAMIEDITEKIQAEEEAQRLEKQLQLAGRLAAVGELAAGVAHELNNPLTAVQAFAQLLVSRDDLDESVKKDLETIYREAQRATKITGNLLSFARRHKPEKKLVSINMIMEESLELHAYRMKLNNIEVNKNLDAKLPMTMADPHQIQQVFVNIITNAEQAIVEASNSGKLWIKTRALDGMVRITFKDDGSGISEENLENIFDPFFTTKDVGRGTGLGLSICYGIIDGHGGRIYAESKPGDGATFVVEIPLVPGDLHNVSKKGLIPVHKT
jgi:PAS domain S-box-containing protein